MTNSYVPLQYGGQAQLAAAIQANDRERLPEMIIAAALHDEDVDFATAVCVQLSGHSDEIVRGNAVLALGQAAASASRAA